MSKVNRSMEGSYLLSYVVIPVRIDCGESSRETCMAFEEKNVERTSWEGEETLFWKSGNVTPKSHVTEMDRGFATRLRIFKESGCLCAWIECDATRRDTKLQRTRQQRRTRAGATKHIVRELAPMHRRWVCLSTRQIQSRKMPSPPGSQSR